MCAPTAESFGSLSRQNLLPLAIAKDRSDSNTHISTKGPSGVLRPTYSRPSLYLTPRTLLSPDEDLQKPQCRTGRKECRLRGHAEMCWPRCAWRQWRRLRGLRCQLVRYGNVTVHDNVLTPLVYRDHVVNSRLPRSCRSHPGRAIEQTPTRNGI